MLSEGQRIERRVYERTHARRFPNVSRNFGQFIMTCIARFDLLLRGVTFLDAVYDVSVIEALQMASVSSLTARTIHKSFSDISRYSFDLSPVVSMLPFRTILQRMQ